MTSEEKLSAASVMEGEEKQPVEFSSDITQNGRTEGEGKLDLRQDPHLGNLQLASDDRTGTGSNANNKTESKDCENKRKVEPHQEYVSSAPSLAESEVRNKDTQAVKQTSATDVPLADGQHMTGYLQQVISSLQSSTLAQSETHDHVMISRWELTQLVKQTLAAQTMCNHLQQLAMENRALKQEKEMLIEIVVQARQWQQHVLKQAGRDVRAVFSRTEGHVFRFDTSPLPKLFSGQEGDSKTDDHKSVERRNDGQSSIASQVESDGESLSLQLPSQLNLDGDTPSNSPPARGASGNVPHQITRQSLQGAGPFHTASVSLNLPASDLIEGAHCYSMGVVPPEGAGVSGAVVSREEYDLALEELEKTKRHVHKLFKDGGIHPDTAVEVAAMKTKLRSLQSENVRLCQELASRPTPETMMRNLTFPPEQKALVEKQIQNRDKRIQMNEQVIAALNMKVKDLEELCRHGPQSQLPSNVGLTALPTIPAVNQSACQTDFSTQLRTAETQTAGPWETENMRQLQQLLEHTKTEKAQLQREIEKLQQQLIQARYNEAEHGVAKEKVQAHNVDLQQQLQEATKHRQELGEVITGLNNEMDILKKKWKDADKTRQALENIIADERKRYDRDEKELLGRLDSVGKERDVSVRQLLAADQSWRTGVPYGTGVPPEYTAHLSNLRTQYTTSSRELASHTSSGRSVPRSNVSGSPGQASGAGHGSNSSQAAGQLLQTRSQGLITPAHPQILNSRHASGGSRTAQSPQRQISDLSGRVTAPQHAAHRQLQGNYYASLPHVPAHQSAAHHHPGNRQPQHVPADRHAPQQHSGSSSPPSAARNAQPHGVSSSSSSSSATRNMQPHGVSSSSSGRTPQHPSRGAGSGSPSTSSTAASVPRVTRQHPQ